MKNTAIHEICISHATNYAANEKTEEALNCLRNVFDQWIEHNEIVPPDQLSYHIVTASSTDGLAEILRLLEQGADINTVNELGETPLHCLIRHWKGSTGLFGNVCQMISWGSDIFIADDSGISCQELLREKLASVEYVLLPKDKE